MYELITYAVFALALLYNTLAKRPIPKTLETMMIVIFLAVFGTRFSVNADTGTYAWLFRSMQDPIKEAAVYHTRRNVLYSLMSFGMKQAFHEFRWLVLLQNVLILAGCFWVVFRFSKNRLLSTMLFIGSGMMEVYYGSGVRQALAMTCFLVGFYAFLPKKQYLLYELCCLIAFGFQDIALVAVPLPLLMFLVKPFRQKPFTVLAWMGGVSIVILVFVYFFLSRFAYWLIDLVGPAPVWTHVIAYARFQQFSVLGIGMELVFLIGFGLLFWFSDKSKFSEFTWFSILVFFVSIFIYLAFCCYDLMSRVSDFIQIIMLVCVPEVLTAIPKKSVRTAGVIGLIGLNGFLLFSDIRANIARINGIGTDFTLMTYPYVNIFDTPNVTYYQNLLDSMWED